MPLSVGAIGSGPGRVVRPPPAVSADAMNDGSGNTLTGAAIHR